MVSDQSRGRGTATVCRAVWPGCMLLSLIFDSVAATSFPSASSTLLRSITSRVEGFMFQVFLAHVCRSAAEKKFPSMT